MIESERASLRKICLPRPRGECCWLSAGCTPDRERELRASAGAYRVELAPAWTEIYKFLTAVAVPAPPPVSAISVVTIRDIMRVINSDDGVRGKLARLLAGFIRCGRAMGSSAIARGSIG